MTQLLRVEFHCHSIYSADSLSSLKALLEVCHKREIDRLVITDHNTIKGALIAKDLDPERVIIGEEIKTNKGELLAAFVKENIPPGLSPLKTIELLKQQNAFICIPHPFDIKRNGWNLLDLLNIAPLVDAIEVFNARCLSSKINLKALRLAEEQSLAKTVGSDAHTLIEVGRATLLLPYFNNANELRQVIRLGKQDVRLSSVFVHLGSTFAYIYKKFRPRSFVSWE